MSVLPRVPPDVNSFLSVFTEPSKSEPGCLENAYENLRIKRLFFAVTRILHQAVGDDPLAKQMMDRHS